DGRTQPVDDRAGGLQRNSCACVAVLRAQGLSVETRAARRSFEPLAVQLRPTLGPARQEPHERAADVDGVALHLEAEDVGKRTGLRLGLVGAQLQLGKPELALVCEQLLDPLPRRMHLEPVPGVRRDERAAPAVLLHAQVPLHRAAEYGLEVVLVERNADMVDARDPPMAGLHHYVDAAALELGKAQLEPFALELLPRRARLDCHVLVADPPVAGDEREPELAQVAGLDVAELRGDEVVVEKLHGGLLSLVFQADGIAVAPHALVVGAAASRADGGGVVPLPAPHADARARRSAGRSVASVDVLDGDRVRRARPQLADRRTRRGALLLRAHGAARDPRRPRAALLRARHDRHDPPAGARAQSRRAPACALASVRRAAGVG